jgi:hypothetical protein
MQPKFFLAFKTVSFIYFKVSTFTLRKSVCNVWGSHSNSGDESSLLEYAMLVDK